MWQNPASDTRHASRVERIFNNPYLNYLLNDKRKYLGNAQRHDDSSDGEEVLIQTETDILRHQDSGKLTKHGLKFWRDVVSNLNISDRLQETPG